MKPAHALLIAAASGLLLNLSCSSDASTNPATGPLGGPVAGATDAHCEGVTPVVVDAAACMTPEPDGGEAGAGGATAEAGDGTAGADCNATHDAEYGETLYNSEGDDDDCKYHAAWSSTPIRLNQDFTVTLTTSDNATQQPLEALEDGALPLSRVEVYQPCQPNRRPPAQNALAKFKETAPGVFTGGPLRLDQPGRWVIRFHLYEQCLDGEHSPHGHLAFFIQVP